MRTILATLLCLALGGCSIVYKLPTRQGNVLDQKQFDLLEVGQTREQVKFLLGTPIATSPFRSDRWDYFGYYKDPRGKLSKRTVSLFFDGDTLARMEGAKIASLNPKNADAPAEADSPTPAADTGTDAEPSPAMADPLSRGTTEGSAN